MIHCGCVVRMKKTCLVFLCLIVVVSVSRVQANEDFSVCPICMTFFEDSMDLIKEAIMSGTVLGCGELCSKVTKDTTTDEVCVALCSVVGLEGLEVLFKKADGDPIYLCELMNVCQPHDCSPECVQFSSVTINPLIVCIGDSFKINTESKVNSSVGPVDFDIEINQSEGGLSGIWQNFNELMEPGTYTKSYEIDVPTDDPDWPAGGYDMDIYVCEGYCHSDHPHSELYDHRRVTFSIKSCED